jgi:hypothetical protein
MPRGSRFALGKPARSDQNGHALPSDRFMRFVALDLVCGNHPNGREPVLASFAVDTDASEFDPDQVYERRPSRALSTQMLSEQNGEVRFRHRMRCPKCGATPVVRDEHVVQALEAIFEPGVYHRIVRMPV